MSRGIVFACSKLPWWNETVRSAQSALRKMPDLPRALFAANEIIQSAGESLQAFNSVHELQMGLHCHRPRLESMLKSPFAESLFVDGDTLFLDGVEELFSILQQFDVGLSLAPQRFHPKAIQNSVYSMLPRVSSAIPEWNSGVIVARRSGGFMEFVQKWSQLLSITSSAGYDMDQPALRSALCNSNLRIATISNNYNYRAIFPQTVVGKVKILHAHGDLPAIGAIINQSLGNRFFGDELRQLCQSHPSNSSYK